MSNERHNAEAWYSALGRQINVTVEIENLPRGAQLALLNHLMQASGTTTVINALPDRGRIFDDINAVWRRYEENL